MSTIVALATPPGIGALHIIRMTGPDSFRIINEISIDPVEKTVDRLQVTFLKSRNGQFIDNVVISKFYSPKSYTGEDCIEISCHGNGIISQLIIEELIKHGAKYAEKGEFTKRAFLNGKIDLNQALNIGKLFQSKNEVDIYSSVQEIRGATSKLINKYIDLLFKLLAECEVNIDYPREIEKEDDNLISSIKNRIKSIYSDLSLFLDSSKKQKFSSYRVVFVGKPNSGKSTLINFLIQKDKIIVSDLEGTTRDPIEVDYCLDGYLLTLVDTAGFKNDEDWNNDLSVKKSFQETLSSDLIVYLISIDDSNPEINFFKEKFKSIPCIQIFTKSDLHLSPPVNSISTKNKDISFLLEELKKHLSVSYSVIGAKFLESINHLSNACFELKRAFESEITIDLISEHIHSAYDHLCNILRCNKDSFEKINGIFDGFCVGK